MEWFKTFLRLPTYSTYTTHTTYSTSQPSRTSSLTYRWRVFCLYFVATTRWTKKYHIILRKYIDRLNHLSHPSLNSLRLFDHIIQTHSKYCRTRRHTIHKTNMNTPYEDTKYTTHNTQQQLPSLPLHTYNYTYTLTDYYTQVNQSINHSFPHFLIWGVDFQECPDLPPREGGEGDGAHVIGTIPSIRIEYTYTYTPPSWICLYCWMLHIIPLSVPVLGILLFKKTYQGGRHSLVLSPLPCVRRH